MESVLKFDGNKIVCGVTDKNVKKIVVPKGITIIEQKAFKGCKNLKSIRLADTIEEIGKEAFAGCSALEEIILPKKLKSLVNFTFEDCSSLKKVTIQDAIINISSRAFERCYNLEEINVSEENKRYCSINGILYNKKKTRLLTAPKKVKESEIIIPEEVTIIETNALNGCENINKVILPSSLEEIKEYAFGNSSIKEIVFPQKHFYLREYAFASCNKLVEVRIPEGIKVIRNGVFRDCESLKKVYIPKSVQKINQLSFFGCSSLEWIDVNTENEFFYSKDGKLYRNGEVEEAILIKENEVNKDGYEPVVENYNLSPDGKSILGIKDPDNFNLSYLEIPEGITTIEEWAFFKCAKLESITFPESLKIIKKRAFANCSELQYADLPDSIEIIGDYAFANCRKLSFTRIPSKATYIGDGAFMNTAIKAVMIPAGIKELKHGAFRGCEHIESFDVEAGNSEYSSKNGVLYNKNMTELLVVPAYTRKRKLEIPKSVITVRENAFLHCKNVYKLVINDALENFPTHVFAKELKDIEDIEVGKKNKLFQMTNGVLFSRDGKTLIKVVLTSAQIRNFEIPSTVEKIYANAFNGCFLIRSVTIPESITEIDKDSFSGCTNLRSIKVLCDLHTISAYSFDALENRGCVAYVPEKWFVEGFKMTALRNFNVYSIEETEEKEIVYLPDVKVVDVSDKDFAHSLCKRVKLVGQMNLGKIEVINHRIYEYLDISEATFGYEDVKWSTVLGYSHHGPVYGRSGVRQEDVLNKFIGTITASILVFPDDVEIQRINYAKYNLSIKKIIVRDTCKNFVYIDGKLVDKRTKVVVF